MLPIPPSCPASPKSFRSSRSRAISSRSKTSFDNADGWTRCWVTLLPLSSCGSWVDYVYAFVSVETTAERPPKRRKSARRRRMPVEDAPAEEVVAEADRGCAGRSRCRRNRGRGRPDVAADEPETARMRSRVGRRAERRWRSRRAGRSRSRPIDEPEPEEPAEAPAAKGGPGFSKLIEGFANLTGFYGQGVKVDPCRGRPPAIEPPAIEPEAIEPARARGTIARASNRSSPNRPRAEEPSGPRSRAPTAANQEPAPAWREPCRAN